ncbi:hypothetical protein CSB37_00395 [bacterium DOLZORAL124_38_8]|nr:MAG: hypothetical protein CSB37_00395 [bacterium DOLZORAL124_38_8]
MAMNIGLVSDKYIKQHAGAVYQKEDVPKSEERQRILGVIPDMIGEPKNSVNVYADLVENKVYYVITSLTVESKDHLRTDEPVKKFLDEYSDAELVDLSGLKFIKKVYI